MSNLEVTETQLWSDAELAAAVDAYLAMLVQQIEGKQVSKAAIVRDLQLGSLIRRSASSISRRMSNISSVLYDLKMPQVQGYAPLPNVGSAVKARVIDLLIQGGVERIAPFAATNDQVELADRVTALRKTGVNFIPVGAKVPEQVLVTSTTYVRNPAVKAWVLQAAAGRCEGCMQAAPFLGVDGLPYLEVHHVMPLSNHGSDRITNAAALCPNCHARCHRSLDRDEFRLELYGQIPRLEMEVPEAPLDDTAVLIDVD
jgi:5-methylcytosine-specific restriction protein A